MTQCQKMNIIEILNKAGALMAAAEDSYKFDL